MYNLVDVNQVERLMIKRIKTKDLKPGMYISDMNRDWVPHNNAKQKGMLKSDEVIEKIKQLGVSELYIDTEKGIDSQDAIPVDEISKKLDEDIQSIGQDAPNYKVKVSLVEERDKAAKLHTQAKGLVQNVLSDVKMGKSLDMDGFDELADNMLDSLDRNLSALSCLGRIREKDSYLMDHSVNLGVLMSVYGSHRNLSRDILHQVMVGALLHDIGKVKIPDSILHKPGKLSDDEFEVMKGHVSQGTALLKTTPGISELAIMVQSQHHEKLDGTGYPLGLAGDEISDYGKMAAITDVYDAITADRVYHKAITPTAAMKKLLEWSDNHLERALVVEFIKCMGIFPVGSLVELDSGRLGVVIEVNEHQQDSPIVKVIYSIHNKSHLEPKVVDLSKKLNQDRIVKSVDPRIFDLKISDYL